MQLLKLEYLKVSEYMGVVSIPNTEMFITIKKSQHFLRPGIDYPKLL